MRFEIRPMTVEDICQAIEVQRQTFSEDLCESQHVFENRFQVFGNHFKVALLNDEVVGYMLSFPWKFGDTPINNQPFPSELPELNCFYIHDITLLPIARGSGLANRLIDSAYETSLKLGFQKVCLVAVEQSGRYWDKCGFLPLSEITDEKDLFIKKVYGEGARLMVKNL